MIKVWIIIVMLSGDARSFTNGPMIIDNIYNKSECERMEQHIKSMITSSSYSDIVNTRCVEVWKVK